MKLPYRCRVGTLTKRGKNTPKNRINFGFIAISSGSSIHLNALGAVAEGVGHVSSHGQGDLVAGIEQAMCQRLAEVLSSPDRNCSSTAGHRLALRAIAQRIV